MSAILSSQKCAPFWSAYRASARLFVAENTAANETMGFGTREQFDVIAQTAKTSKDMVVAHEQLDTLMLTCIACHSIYRLAEPQE